MALVSHCVALDPRWWKEPSPNMSSVDCCSVGEAIMSRLYFRVAAGMLVYSLCLRQLAAHSSRCRRSLRWVWPLDGDHNGSRLWGVSHHVALQWSLLLLLSCCCGCRVSSVARHKLCCVLRFIFVRMAHMLKLSSVEVSWSSVELSSVGHRIASWVEVQLSRVELGWSQLVYVELVSVRFGLWRL